LDTVVSGNAQTKNLFKFYHLTPPERSAPPQAIASFLLSTSTNASLPSNQPQSEAVHYAEVGEYISWW
jgi:hypothetical protein